MSVVHIDPIPAPRGAMALETLSLTKRFGSFTALDAVSITVKPGTVHALLGENGAGKSTLVKCVAGFHTPDGGAVLCDGREQEIATPVVARALGIGMVYQHFTLAPGMTVAENLLLAGGRLPALIDWRAQRARLGEFLERMPFQLDLDARPVELAAGEKQKLELLKQIYLRPRLLILDEPTSVLTPQEADEVLGLVREFARTGQCTVLLITHKFREVMAYADDVTVLRRGALTHRGAVAMSTPQVLAQAMIGVDIEANRKAGASTPEASRAAHVPGTDAASTTPHRAPVFTVSNLAVRGDRGSLAVNRLSLQLHAGEILGVAGVSGNGQRELMEAIVGQRSRAAGEVHAQGRRYSATREQNRSLRIRSLPEEPLRNGCVPDMSVAENMALRDFDVVPMSRLGILQGGVWRERAKRWIADLQIKTRGDGAPAASLSGGNLQRVILARELAGHINVLIAMNPVFGLDFAAVREIHERIMQVSEAGGAVLLISEDLDELLELTDRIVVMSEGRIVYETATSSAQRHVLGEFMGGGRIDADKEIAT